jgi:hypothetical protein
LESLRKKKNFIDISSLCLILIYYFYNFNFFFGFILFLLLFDFIRYFFYLLVMTLFILNSIILSAISIMYVPLILTLGDVHVVGVPRSAGSKVHAGCLSDCRHRLLNQRNFRRVELARFRRRIGNYEDCASATGVLLADTVPQPVRWSGQCVTWHTQVALLLLLSVVALPSGINKN